jgi:hypothetical protein
MRAIDIATWLSIMLVIEGAAILFVGWLSVSGHVLQFPKILSIGILLLSFGLMVQVIRSLYYLEHGHYPVDTVFPFWILKDIGGSLIIYYFTFWYSKNNNNKL